MLGFLVGGVVRLLLRVWAFGLFYFMENRLVSWIKGIATPQLPYKKIPPFEEERSQGHQYKGVDSRLCLVHSSHNSWNTLFLNSSKKLPFIWIAKTMMFSTQTTGQKFSMKSHKLDDITQALQSPHSVSEVAAMEHKNLKTEAFLKNSSSLVPKEVLSSYFDMRKEEVGLAEHCILKDFYNNIIPKEKLDLLKPDDTTLSAFEKHFCSSAGSIDSGYQSFPSVESAYTCIEEGGVTLYLSDCCYNKDGKLISMNIGFGNNEDSTSSNSFEFDNGISDNVSDSDCESDSESEEDFIVFDAGSSCEETECFDTFVFEGTADQISVALSMNTCCQSKLEINLSQTLLASCPCQEKNCSSVESEHLKSKHYFSDNTDYYTKTKTQDSGSSAGTVPKKKKVQFQIENTEIHEMVAWDFAYRQARIGHWKNYAIDRMQFQRRIDHIAGIVEPVLEKKISQMKN